MDDKPSQALRRGRWKSSMWKAIEAVRDGDADACVSAGNTGALMAMAKFCLRTLPAIERPAIAALWPTIKSECIVLDVGATIGADAQQLVDFAILGSAMAQAVFQLKRPMVGLLNVGVEEIKGQEDVKEAGRMLREANLPSMNYHGFVEGDDISKGTVDVVVTEGFAGNIALKTAEGTVRQVGTYLQGSDEPHADGAYRLRLRQERIPPPAREAGCAQEQWRRFPRPQRAGGEEPRRHRRRRVCRTPSNLPTTWAAAACWTRFARSSTCSLRACRSRQPGRRRPAPARTRRTRHR